MAAILQTIMWKQYFIHIAPKFGNWFGNVLCQMETTKNCPQYVNTVRPRQCDRHFTDNVFKLIQIAPNCIHTAPRFKNKFGSTLFQIEFWPRCFNTFRPRQCGCHFTDVFKLISFYKAFVFSFTIQFETWRLICLRHNHWTQVIYCGPHKMTAILQTNLKCIFLHGNCCIFLEISFKFENILDNFVNDVFKYLSWMETFAVFIHITFFKLLTKIS